MHQQKANGIGGCLMTFPNVDATAAALPPDEFSCPVLCEFGGVIGPVAHYP
jgi:hypothetical protein